MGLHYFVCVPFVFGLVVVVFAKSGTDDPGEHAHPSSCYHNPGFEDCFNKDSLEIGTAGVNAIADGVSFIEDPSVSSAGSALSAVGALALTMGGPITEGLGIFGTIVGGLMHLFAPHKHEPDNAEIMGALQQGFDRVNSKLDERFNALTDLVGAVLLGVETIEQDLADLQQQVQEIYAEDVLGFARLKELNSYFTKFSQALDTEDKRSHSIAHGFAEQAFKDFVKYDWVFSMDNVQKTLDFFHKHHGRLQTLKMGQAFMMDRWKLFTLRWYYFASSRNSQSAATEADSLLADTKKFQAILKDHSALPLSFEPKGIFSFSAHEGADKSLHEASGGLTVASWTKRVDQTWYAIPHASDGSFEIMNANSGNLLSVDCMLCGAKFNWKYHVHFEPWYFSADFTLLTRSGSCTLSVPYRHYDFSKIGHSGSGSYNCAGVPPGTFTWHLVTNAIRAYVFRYDVSFRVFSGGKSCTLDGPHVEMSQHSGENHDLYFNGNGFSTCNSGACDAVSVAEIVAQRESQWSKWLLVQLPNNKFILTSAGGHGMLGFSDETNLAYILQSEDWNTISMWNKWAFLLTPNVTLKLPVSPAVPTKHWTLAILVSVSCFSSGAVLSGLLVRLFLKRKSQPDSELRVSMQSMQAIP